MNPGTYPLLKVSQHSYSLAAVILSLDKHGTATPGTSLGPTYLICTDFGSR